MMGAKTLIRPWPYRTYIVSIYYWLKLRSCIHINKCYTCSHNVIDYNIFIINICMYYILKLVVNHNSTNIKLSLKPE